MSEGAKVATGDKQDDLQGGPVVDRGCTDILCCIIFVLYMIFMIVMASQGFASGEPYRLVAVWDSSWSPCGLDDLADYKYVYFAIPHPDHLNKTTCVKECPNYLDSANKPNSLECNLKNQTAFEEYGCNANCGPFSESKSDTSDQGWSITLSLNWQDLLCIYNTTVLAGRICFPGAEIFGYVEGLASGITNSLNLDQLTSWMNDVDKGLDIIFASFAIIFVLGLVYMLFVRIFSGVIVWFFIILYFIFLALLGIYIHQKSLDIDQAIKDNNNIESGENTKQNRDMYLYVSYGIGILWLISLIGLFCMFNNIRLAIAIIKTSSDFMRDVWTALLIPPVLAVLTIIWWLAWVYGFVYVYAVGDVVKRSEGSIFATVIHDDQQKVFVWCFIFGGLWVNAFLQAITQFLLASTVSIWYFAQPDGNANKPVLNSIFRAFRYHLGSLAFGAFILAIVQTIRLMFEYLDRQMKAAGAEQSKIMQYVMKCIRCCLACFERCIKFLNKNAFIQIALAGKNFCVSAKNGMKIVWENMSRVSLVSGLGAAFIFVGKIFMICVNCYICYLIYQNVEPYKTEMNSTFLPLVIIFVISWGVATIFLSVYGMAIDTVLMCFLHDEKMQKANPNRKMCAPPLLMDFMGQHDDKAKFAEEQKEKAKEKAKK